MAVVMAKTLLLLLSLLLSLLLLSTHTTEAASRWTLPPPHLARTRTDAACDTEEQGEMAVGQSLFVDGCRKLVCKSIVGRPIIEEHFCETLPSNLPETCSVQEGRGTQHPDCCAKVVCSTGEEFYDYDATDPAQEHSSPYNESPKSPHIISASVQHDPGYRTGIPRSPRPQIVRNRPPTLNSESLRQFPVYHQNPAFPQVKVPPRYSAIRRPQVPGRGKGRYPVPVPARRPTLPLRRPSFNRPLRMSNDVVFGQGYSLAPASLRTISPAPVAHLRPERLPSLHAPSPPKLHSWLDEPHNIPLDPPNNGIQLHEHTGDSFNYYDDVNEELSQYTEDDPGDEILWDVPESAPDYQQEAPHDYSHTEPSGTEEYEPLSQGNETSHYYRDETPWEQGYLYPNYNNEPFYGDGILSTLFPEISMRHPSLSISGPGNPFRDVSYAFYTNPREVRTSPHPYRTYPVTTPTPLKHMEGLEPEDNVFPTNSILYPYPESFNPDDTPWRQVLDIISTTTLPPATTTTTTTTTTTSRTTPTTTISTTPPPSERRPSFPRIRRPSIIRTYRPSSSFRPTLRYTTRQPQVQVTTWRPRMRSPISKTKTTDRSRASTPDILHTTPNPPTSTPDSYEFATARLNPSKHDIHEFFHTPLDPSELIPGHEEFVKSKEEAKREYQDSDFETSSANKTRRSLGPAISKRETSREKHRPVFHIPWRKNVNVMSPSSTQPPQEEMDEVFKAETFHPVRKQRPSMNTELFILDFPSQVPTSKTSSASFYSIESEREIEPIEYPMSMGEERINLMEERNDGSIYDDTYYSDIMPKRNSTGLVFPLKDNNVKGSDVVPSPSHTFTSPSDTLDVEGRVISEGEESGSLARKRFTHYHYDTPNQRQISTMDVRSETSPTPPTIPLQTIKWSPPPFRSPESRQHGVRIPSPDHIQMPDYGSFPEKDHLGVLLYEPIKQGPTNPSTPPQNFPSKQRTNPRIIPPQDFPSKQRANPNTSPQTLPSKPKEAELKPTADTAHTDFIHDANGASQNEGIAYKSENQMQTEDNKKDIIPKESHTGVDAIHFLNSNRDNHLPDHNQSINSSSSRIHGAYESSTTSVSEMYYDDALYDEHFDYEDPEYYYYYYDYGYEDGRPSLANVTPKQGSSNNPIESVLQQKPQEPSELQVEEPSELIPPRWKTNSGSTSSAERGMLNQSQSSDTSEINTTEELSPKDLNQASLQPILGEDKDKIHNYFNIQPNEKKMLENSDRNKRGEDENVEEDEQGEDDEENGNRTLEYEYYTEYENEQEKAVYFEEHSKNDTRNKIYHRRPTTSIQPPYRFRDHTPSIVTTTPTMTTTTTYTTTHELLDNTSKTSTTLAPSSFSFNQISEPKLHRLRNNSTRRTTHQWRPTSISGISNGRLRGSSVKGHSSSRISPEYHDSTATTRSQERLTSPADKQMRLPPPTDRRIPSRPQRYGLQLRRVSSEAHRMSNEGTREKGEKDTLEAQDIPTRQTTI